MLPIFMVEAYDPQSPEDSGSRGSSYLSKKDFKWIALILVFLGIALYPVYLTMLAEKNKHVCQANLSQIYKAVLLYAESHDQRFPPAFEAGKGGYPKVDEQGRTFTWVSLVQDGMNSRQSFFCPETEKAEASHSEHPQTSQLTVDASYGMYFPYAGFALANVPNPDQVVIFGETSSSGEKKTANPVPLKGDTGPIADGFLIGFNDSNRDYSKSTEYVTRLAFPLSEGGNFKESGPSRHQKGIFLMTASGSVSQYTPNTARLEVSGGRPVGKWAIPVGWGPNN